MPLLISVIVPTFQEEQYIRNLLESLRKQTYRNFEVIVVDGGSRDRTVEIAKNYETRTIVRPGEPEFESRNIGGKIAKGNLLLFTSADVIFEAGALQMLADQFEKDATLGGLCGFGLGRVYDAPLWTKIEYNFYYTTLGLWTKLTKDFHGNGSFIAIRQRLFGETGGFTGRTDADGFFLNSLGKRTKVKFVLDLPMRTSGRRAKKMGFVGFNTHYLFALDAFLPLAREMRPVKFLEDYMINYRKRHKRKVLDSV